jgi:hypothetical protein
MMNALIPAWIIGGPFLGLLFLSFSFKGHSAMGGELPRSVTRPGSAVDNSVPLSEPMHPDAPRRNI